MAGYAKKQSSESASVVAQRPRLPYPRQSSACPNRLLKSPLHAQSFRLVRNLGAMLTVCVHPSRHCNNECGPAWKTRRARPEGPICCALSLGKGTTLSVATKHNSCTLLTTLSTQGAFQQPASAAGHLFLRAARLSHEQETLEYPQAGWLHPARGNRAHNPL